MSVSVVTYGGLNVSTYRLNDLVELKIVKQLNEHVKLFLTGILPEDMKDSYIEMTKSKTNIEVTQSNDNVENKALFKGTVTNIKIKAVRSIYYIEVEALSNTFNLDIKLKDRSFQNKDMPYTSLIKEVISDYPGSDSIDTVSNGETLKKFTMQYKETDWQFLKRMASRFNAPLIPDSTSDKPKFWFGIPDGLGGGSLDEFNYSVNKKISDFRFSSENYIEGIQDNDYVYYEVESDILLDIGSKVGFKGENLFVYKVVTIMKKNILKHQYILSPKKGFSQNKIYNKHIIGLSLKGKVIDREKDNLKVHLEIDESQSIGEAWWFNYSSVYTAEDHTGWYCMPELKDSVMVYFPNKDEGEGVSISSIRESNEYEKLQNPDIRYFRTKSGKELKFSPDEILITARDGGIYIRLNEKGGIEIISTQGINISSQKDININSGKNLTISSGEEINISCKQSNIKINDEINITGKHVKIN